MKSRIFVFVLLLAFGCSKDSLPPADNKITKGKNMFYVKELLSCGSITVTIDNLTKTISSAAGANPSCSHSGSAMFELEVGIYKYTAKCDQGTQTWSGEIKIYEGNCYTTELEVKPDVVTPTEGQVLIWTDKDRGCGSVKITIEGSSQDITTFWTGGIPNCESEGAGAVFKLKPGTYSYIAECQKYKWQGSFDVFAGKCSLIQLEEPLEIIPTYSFSEPGLLQELGDITGGPTYRIVSSEKLIAINVYPNTTGPVQINVAVSSSITSPATNTGLKPLPGPIIRFDFVRTLALNQDETKVYAALTNRRSFADQLNPTMRIYSIDTKTGEATFIADEKSIGKVHQLNINSAGELIASTSLNNGSLIKIEQDGSVKVIVSNLVQPANFVEYEGKYFVTVNDVTKGSVVVVGSDGVVRNLVTDLLKPNDIVLDKNGNFIVKSEKTIDGGNYFVYDLYSSTGKFIANLVDPNKYLIVTYPVFPNSAHLFTPMFIDENNNFVFDHIGGNPKSNNKRGFWRIALKTQ